MIKKGWEEEKLEDICVLVTDGTHDSPKLLEKGIPFIKGKHISSGKLDFDNCDYISYEDHLEVIKRSKPERDDILFANIGTLGSTVYINTDREFSIKNVALFKLNKTKIIPRYFYYWLLNPCFKKSILNLKSGVAQGFLTLEELRNFKVRYIKDKKIQKKITVVLSNYDNLFENNEKRIKILEQIAKLIYEEWFVKFKFPGYENLKIIDSGTDLGKIPEGWGVDELSSIAEIQRGCSYRGTELSEEEGVAFVNLKCLLPGGNGGFRRSGIKRYTGKFKEVQKLIGGDIVMAITEVTQKREIIARPARIPRLNENDITFSMDLVKIIPKDNINKDWLYSFLKYSSFGITVKEFANGVNVLHLNPGKILDYKLIIPSEEIRNKFSYLISNLFNLIDILELKNQNLRKTRDLLLPKLISGEIDVSDLDIKIPEIEA